MKWNIIAAVIIVIIAAGAILFFYSVQGDNEDETEWGSWFQNYEVYYTDGTSSSLSFLHNNKEVSHIDYLLKVDVSEEYTTSAVTFNFDNYNLDIKTDGTVISTLELEGSTLIDPASEKQTLFTKTIDLSPLESYEPGDYTLTFIPSGTVSMDGSNTELPSSASVDITIEQSTGNEVNIIWDTGVEWSQ